MSKVFEKLKAKGLFKPLPPKQGAVPTHVEKNFYCQFHQRHGHSTDRCTHLRYEMQDLIDNEKIIDPEESRPSTGKNPLLNHANTSFVKSVKMIASGLTTKDVMISFENDAEIKEEEAEEEEEVTSRCQPLWDQDEDSDMDEWIGIVGGWIKPGELARKEEGESSRKPKTESPELDDVQMNGWLDASKREMKEEERLETESGWIAATNVWDSSDEEDGGADIWDEEIQSESDEEVAEKPKNKVHELTRSGCHYQDKGREAKKEKGKEPIEEIPEQDNLILKQLKKTQAQASVWDLLCSSEKHRRTMVEALANIKISTDVEAD